MKTKLMHLLVAAVAILVLGVSQASAGVLGKYNVSGKEGPYSFRGTLKLTSYTACTVRLNYNDGDSIIAKGRFKTPLKNTRKVQTVNCIWTAYGMNGTGKVTVSGTKTGHRINFTYSGFGVSGSGSGTKTKK